MSRSYQEYNRKLIAIARRQDEAEQAARNQAAARRAAKRLELQPEYEAVGQWQSEQIKARGLSWQVVNEVAKKLAALDAQVAAA